MNSGTETSSRKNQLNEYKIFIEISRLKHKNKLFAKKVDFENLEEMELKKVFGIVSYTIPVRSRCNSKKPIRKYLN